MRGEVCYLVVGPVPATWCLRVLVVEDQVTLADDIADGLRDQGFAADVAYDGSAGLEKALMNRYDVIVLDRDLPKSMATPSVRRWSPDRRLLGF